MKNYIYILLVFLLAFSACEKELLEQTNPNAVTPETFWVDESGLQKGLNAAYSAMQFPSIWGGLRTQLWQRSDISYYTYIWGGAHTDFGTFQYTNNTSVIPQLWSDLYIGILRSNQVIRYAKEVSDPQLTEDSRNEIIGQARFLRAFFYFDLAYNYGQGIIRDENYANDEIEKATVPKEDIIERMIKPDLYAAINSLPQVWSGDQGKASSGAAKTLLAKTYLYEENWDSAAILFKQVIDQGTYSLDADPVRNFVYAGEFNSESIFEINFNETVKPNTPAGTHDDYPSFDNTTGSEAVNLSIVFAGYDGGGYNSVQPTYWLEELFCTGDEKDPTDSRNGTFTRRTYASILNQSMEGPYLGSDDPAEYAAFRYGWSGKVKKWIPWDTQDGPFDMSLQRTGVNYKNMRLADVYLMYAEAILMRDGDGAVAEAIQYIDLVRDRAGAITLSEYQAANGGQIPRLDVSLFYTEHTTGATEHPLTNVNAQSLLHHLQMVERPLELCFEGHRWFDLVRWGIISDVFAQRYLEEQNMINVLCTEDPASKDIDSDKADLFGPWYLEEAVRSQFEAAAARYNSAQHDYLPVPDIEIQSNQNAAN